MRDIKLIKNGLANNQEDFISDIMGELQSGENIIGAKELASTIKKLLSAKTINNAGIEMDDNKVILDTVKLVLNFNGVKTGNQVNIFNITAPPKNKPLEF